MKTTRVFMEVIFKRTGGNVNELEAGALGVTLGLEPTFTRADLRAKLFCSYYRISVTCRVLVVLGLIVRLDRTLYKLTSKGHAVLNEVIDKLYPPERKEHEVETAEAIVEAAKAGEITAVPVVKGKRAFLSDAQKERNALGFDTKGIPIEAVRIALRLVNRLRMGATYRQLDGKELKYRNKNVISIPIGRKWRMLCLKNDEGKVEPKKILSHEDYNDPRKRSI